MFSISRELNRTIPEPARGVFELCRSEKTSMNRNAGVTGDYWSSSTYAAGNINAADSYFRADVVNPLNDPDSIDFPCTASSIYGCFYFRLQCTLYPS